MKPTWEDLLCNRSNRPLQFASPPEQQADNEIRFSANLSAGNSRASAGGHLLSARPLSADSLDGEAATATGKLAFKPVQAIEDVHYRLYHEVTA